MLISTIVVLSSLFAAFVITALEPRLAERSARIALLQPTDAVPLRDTVLAPPR